VSIRKRTWSGSDGAERSGWQADYLDAKGIRRRKMFARKKDAEHFLLTARTEVRDGIHVPDAESVTVAEAGKLWLAAKTRAGRERSTTDQYRQHLELHIVPLIGEDRLNALTVPRIRGFEEKLLDAGRSPAMVRKVLVSLGSILGDAQERGLTVRNPVRDMRGRRGSTERRADRRAKGKLKVGEDIPTPAEVKAIVGALRGRWRPLLLTALFCGLRASELRGLRWTDVDLDGRVLHVSQRADRFNDIGRPKSEAGERELPMPALVANSLREWQLACPLRDTGDKNADGTPIMVRELVFPNGAGKVESLGNIINRGLVPTQLAAGVSIDTGERDANGDPILAAKYTGLHALRHFHASWLINRRADGGLELPAKVVQERLGHSTIAMTLDVYGHLFPRQDGADEINAAASAFL
jgi:integrase